MEARTNTQTKPANLRFQDAGRRHPMQNRKHPPTETATNFKNCGTGIIFMSKPNCSEGSSGRQPIPHLDPHHPSATFRRSHTPVPASPKSVTCADEIDALRWPNLPKMKIVPPHDIKEKNNTITLAKWHPPAESRRTNSTTNSSSSFIGCTESSRANTQTRQPTIPRRRSPTPQAGPQIPCD